MRKSILVKKGLGSESIIKTQTSKWKNEVAEQALL